MTAFLLPSKINWSIRDLRILTTANSAATKNPVKPKKIINKMMFNMVFTSNYFPQREGFTSKNNLIVIRPFCYVPNYPIEHANYNGEVTNSCRRIIVQNHHVIVYKNYIVFFIKSQLIVPNKYRTIKKAFNFE